MPALQFGSTYHIFNRGNNKEDLFKEEENYRYFLFLYKKYITPIATTYAYCLLKNHFHFLIRINDENEQSPVRPGVLLNPSRIFSNFFNAYAKAINMRYKRCGSLFQDRFRRKEVKDSKYLMELVRYIHQNPVHHHFTHDLEHYQYSSYRDILAGDYAVVTKDTTLGLFGGMSEFEFIHSKEDYDNCWLTNFLRNSED